MRANRQMPWQNRPVQPQYRNAQMQQSHTSSPSSSQAATGETEVMRLARKIMSEQGEKMAGHFLYAMRPYAAPGEISHIEATLNLHAERDPSLNKSSSPANSLNMIQLLMRLMQGGQKPDPMTLMKMMSG